MFRMGWYGLLESCVRGQNFCNAKATSAHGDEGETGNQLAFLND